MSRPRLPLSVLIVEDEALLAMDLEALIEDGGHRVVAEAACLQEVEELDGALRVDLAFVDINLAHGSSGLDVSRLLRDRWSDVLIVFVTANPLKIPADYAGGDGVIAKPFSRTGVLSALRYIEQGVCDPPPELPRPDSFTAAPALAAAWRA